MTTRPINLENLPEFFRIQSKDGSTGYFDNGDRRDEVGRRHARRGGRDSARSSDGEEEEEEEEGDLHGEEGDDDEEEESDDDEEEEEEVLLEGTFDAEGNFISGVKSTRGKSSKSKLQTEGVSTSAKRRIWDQLKPSDQQGLLAAIEMDKISVFSTTHMSHADAISRHVLNHLESKIMRGDRDWIITDATACVGGNTISFARYFTRVNAVELDERRCEMLWKNVCLLKEAELVVANGRGETPPPVSALVNVYCGDCFSLVPRLGRQDAVFVDPPWGGKTYKSRAQVQVYLSSRPLHKICSDLLRYTSLVVMKLPNNANLSGVQSNPGLKIARVEKVSNFTLIFVEASEEYETARKEFKERTTREALTPRTAEDAEDLGNLRRMLESMMKTEQFVALLSR